MACPNYHTQHDISMWQLLNSWKNGSKNVLYESQEVIFLWRRTICLFCNHIAASRGNSQTIAWTSLIFSFALSPCFLFNCHHWTAIIHVLPAPALYSSVAMYIVHNVMKGITAGQIPKSESSAFISWNRAKSYKGRFILKSL